MLSSLDIARKEDTEFFERIFFEAFPQIERRPLDVLFDLYKNNPHFEVELAKEKDKNIGLFCYWDLDEFIFGEYLAIDSTLRNGGYGKLILEEFLSKISKPLVAEVELPETEMAQRRIGFYKRLGFNVWEGIDYLQPPYYKGAPYLPMILISHGNIDVDKNKEEITSRIHTNVYGIIG